MITLDKALEYWKSILAFIVVIVGATVGVVSWAEDQKQVLRIEQQLIHSKLYQEDRVQRKRDQIQDNLKMIRLLQSGQTLTQQEQKFIDSLTKENTDLLKEIEELEAEIHTQ